MLRVLVTIVLVLMVLAPTARAAAIAIDPNVARYDIENLELLEDPSGALGIDDVRNAEHAERFVPHLERLFSKGLSSSAFWVRFRLVNAATQPQDRFLELGRATLDDVEIHYPAGHAPAHKRFNRFDGFSARDVPHRFPVFRVTLPPDSEVTLHLRVYTENEVFFPMRLYTADGLRVQERHDYFIIALYSGAIFILALYHLGLYWRLRERHLLYFVAYLAGFGSWMWFIDGLPYGQIESVAPKLGTLAFVLTGWLSLIPMLLFARSFLATREHTPRLHRALNIALVVVAIIAAYAAVGDWRVGNRLAALVWVTVNPLIVVCAITRWRQGMGAAGWFALGFGFYLGAGVLGALWLNGLAPLALDVEELNPFRWGVLGETVFMSVALASRINQLGQERAEAQAFALARGQLAEAEKSAALGRLMAGILHEVNTPLGALRSASETLGKTFTRVKKYVGDDKKANRAVEAGTQLSEVVDESSTRIASVIDSLKRFVAVDETAKKRVDLRLGLDGALTLLAPKLREASIERDYPDEPVEVLCAPSKLNHALLEVLQRAADALDGSGTLRVSLERGSVTIHDDGPEIPQPELDAIFDFGFKQEQGRVRANMGLPLAKGTIEELGGTLRIESGADGTTATISLPV